jgi:hypothetical protein
MRSDATLRRMAQVVRRIASNDPMALALRLTALGLLLRPVGGPRLRPAFLALAAFLLVAPRARYARVGWAALLVLAVARLVADWPLGDNHAYLLAYWCLAVTLAFGDVDPRGALAENGRLLIGLTFAFAILWKAVLSSDFADGTFFRVTILADPRLAGLAPVASGLSPEDLSRWRDWIGGHALASEAPGPVPTRLAAVAGVATAWTLLIEAAAAASFLAPSRWRLARARDALLVVFCATTYAVIPVTGFAWLLLAMGAAQSSPERSAWRAAYVAVFVWVAFAAALHGAVRTPV